MSTNRLQVLKALTHFETLCIGSETPHHVISTIYRLSYLMGGILTHLSNGWDITYLMQWGLTYLMREPACLPT